MLSRRRHGHHGRKEKDDGDQGQEWEQEQQEAAAKGHQGEAAIQEDEEGGIGQVAGSTSVTGSGSAANVDYTQLQDHAHIINATFLNPGGSTATSDVEGIEMMVSTGDQFVVREDEVDVLVIPGPCGKCGKLTLPLKPEKPPALA